MSIGHGYTESITLRVKCFHLHFAGLVLIMS